MSDLLNPARANSIGALFVFLHLLKCQTQGVAEFLLTHSKHHATHPHATADMLVGRIRRLLGQHDRLLFPRIYLSQCGWIANRAHLKLLLPDAKSPVAAMNSGIFARFSCAARLPDSF